MRAKTHPLTSEIEAKDKLVIYVYEYLTFTGATKAAAMFKNEINYGKDIQINESDRPGFLLNWWCVFWDLYCAAPERRNTVDASIDARTFHDYNNPSMRTVMSPSLNQTSPPGPPFMGAGGPMMGGPRYGPPHGGPLRGGPMNVGSRIPPMNQGGPPPPPHMGGPPPHPHPHPQMMGAASPRYAPHPGHMTPGSSASSGPMAPEPGPSPGVNRMTPNHSGSPHPQAVPPNGMGPMSGPPGPPGGPHAGPHGVPQPGQPMGQGGPMQPMQQRGGPPQGWQGNFNVNSPADQQCFMPGPPVPAGGQQGDQFGGMMMNDGGMMDVKPPGNDSGAPNQQQDEYVMPNAYGQQDDQGEAGVEIMKLKETLQSNTNGGDQSGFGMDFPESQNKW